MEIGIVSAYDWEGLYIDGKCVKQSHRITSDDIIYELIDTINKNGSVTITKAFEAFADEEQLTRHGKLVDLDHLNFQIQRNTCV